MDAKRLFVKILFAFLAVALIMSAFLPATGAQAATKTKFFKISVTNAMKAVAVGYPYNYRFVHSIYQDGVLVRQYLLRQGERVETTLPAGWYAFVLSDRKGKVLDRTRYYHILGGKTVRWQSNLGPPNLKPQIKIRIK
jgi:hypothetical protein